MAKLWPLPAVKLSSVFILLINVLILLVIFYAALPRDASSLAKPTFQTQSAATQVLSSSLLLLQVSVFLLLTYVLFQCAPALSSTILACILSFLHSLAGLPEVDK